MRPRSRKSPDLGSVGLAQKVSGQIRAPWKTARISIRASMMVPSRRPSFGPGVFTGNTREFFFGCKLTSVGGSDPGLDLLALPFLKLQVTSYGLVHELID